jgi:uncharacterized membrane protein
MTQFKRIGTMFAVLVIVVMGALAVFAYSARGDASDQSGVRAPLTTDADLVIQISEQSPEARFYPVDVEGTRLEVIAVQAPDGSVRTAFNTCQVCYGSGYGYYVQEGTSLVCQNCGNRFKINQVEVAKGGCNPVPIFPEYKTVDAKTITIPYSFLKEAKTIFGNWKAEE